MILVQMFVLCLNVIDATVEEIPCEEIENNYWDNGGYLRTCFMDKNLAIESRGFTMLKRDTSIGALEFTRNRKISFLPTSVNKKFPNLLAYAASACGISEIWKENFKDMSRLKTLWLSYNNIERIYSDTFEDLQSLEKLFLRKIYKLYQCF